MNGEDNYKRGLEHMKAHPEFADIEAGVRKSLQQRFPGYNRAPSSKSRSTVILPKNGVSGVTINQ